MDLHRYEDPKLQCRNFGFQVTVESNSTISSETSNESEIEFGEYTKTDGEVEVKSLVKLNHLILNVGLNNTENNFNSEQKYLETEQPNIVPHTEQLYDANRAYIRNSNDINGNKISEENYDWNGDGMVNEDETKILERFILTSPPDVM